MTEDPERLTIPQAAERLGISVPAVRAQVRRLRVIVGDDGRIDFPAYVRARQESLNPTVGGNAPGGAAGAHLSEATNLKRLQSQRLELRLAQERGELVRRADVERSMTWAGQRIRDAAMSVPARAAQELAGVTDIVEVKRILTDHMRAFLEAYASDLAERAFTGGSGDDAGSDAG